MLYKDAIEQLNAGKKITRKDWVERNVWLFLISKWSYTSSEGTVIETESPFIAMSLANDKLVPWNGTTASTNGDDWIIVD